MARWTAGLAPVLTLAVLLSTLAPRPAEAGGYPEAEKAYSMGRLLVDLGDTTRGLFELKKAVSIVPSARYIAAIIKTYRDQGKDEQALVWGERYLGMTAPEERDEALAAWLGQVLERLRATHARIEMTVFPEDARVEYIAEDGTIRAGVPDGTEGRLVWWLGPGRGTLTVRKDGWAESSRDLSLEPGATEEIAVLLKRATGEGDLIVECSVAGAEIRIDGHVAGIAPLEITRPAGRYVIQVWAKNHLDWTGFATVAPEKATRVLVHLTRSPGAAAPVRQTIQWKPPRRGLGLSGWGWITMGLGVAMGGAVGYTSWAMNQSVVKARKAPEGSKARQNHIKDYTSFQGASIALGAAGGAAVAAGLLMVLLDDSDGNDTEATLEMLSFAPGITPDGFTLNSEITF